MGILTPTTTCISLGNRSQGSILMVDHCWVGAWQGVFSPDIVIDEDLWRQFRKDFYTVSDEYIGIHPGCIR